MTLQCTFYQLTWKIICTVVYWLIFLDLASLAMGTNSVNGYKLTYCDLSLDVRRALNSKRCISNPALKITPTK